MASSLRDLSLLALRNTLESGYLPNIYSLPVSCRQSLLDSVLKHGSINYIVCLAALSAPPFFFGMTSLDLQSGIVNDRFFLQYVAGSLTTVLPDGSKIGDQILELKVNLYGHIIDDLRGFELNLKSLINLIGQCPNLKSFSIRMVESKMDESLTESMTENGITAYGLLAANRTEGSEFGKLLNNLDVWSPCLSILENLEKLEVQGIGDQSYILDSGFFELITFKNLKSVKFGRCRMFWYDWAAFLETAQSSLVAIHLDSSFFLYNGTDRSDNVLPILLPNLEIFYSAEKLHAHQLHPDIYPVLCPNLKHVH